MTLVRAVLAAGLVTVAVSGCGSLAPYDGPSTPAFASPAAAPTPSTTPKPYGYAEITGAVGDPPVLLDGTWTVTEGQWWFGQMPGKSVDFTRLVSSSRHNLSVAISAPGFYGRYRVRVELLDSEPAIPAWCEDVAEASLHADSTSPDGPPVMGEFETFTDTLPLPDGWYRLRYCAEDEDRAAKQPEFDAHDDYTIYAGRHLVQLWSAPEAPDRTIRTGSHWASVVLPRDG